MNGSSKTQVACDSSANVKSAQLDKNRNWIRITLASLQLFIGLPAIATGLLLVLDRSGASMGFSLSQLHSSPFPDFFVPGLFLLAINGIGTSFGGVITLMSKSRSGDIAVFLGIFLMTWIVIQVMYIDYHWLQPLYFSFGVVELLLGLKWRQPHSRLI